MTTNTAAPSQALNDDEFDRLESFLSGAGTMMNLEAVDGYFAALICGPDMVLPGEYLPQIWGDDLSFDSDDQARDILDLLMRHWNTIASELLNTLREASVYLPVLLEDEAGVAHGNDWAQGFMRGVHLRATGWRELMESDEQGAPLLPIMMLAHEHDPDPALRPPAVRPEQREALVQMMIAGLPRIYRYFEAQRRAVAGKPHPPLRRAGAKIGRNEPCICGSGRKFKHCCAAGAPAVH